MKKIAVLSRDLNVGGIQRSLCNFLKNIDLNKYEVDCYLYNKNNFYSFVIPDKINIIYLKPRLSIIKFISFNIVKLFSTCKLKNKEYDYVIDYDGYQTDTAIDTILSNSKVKACYIHSNVNIRYKEELKYRILHFFMKGKYLCYNKYIAVSKGVIKPFEVLNKISISDKVTVIPSFIDTKEIFNEAKEPCDLKVDVKRYNFVSVGRICNAKGYDLLMGYLKQLLEYRNDFHFYLIGDGPNRNKLESLIDSLNLSNYVTLLGHQTNPFKYMNLMDGLILTSRYEGQGMVLLEAKSLGLELFMTKNLEQYNHNLVGYEDIVKALKSAKKKVKTKDDLKEYNDEIKKEISSLLI